MIEAKHTDKISWYEENGEKVSRDFPIDSKRAQVSFIKNTGIEKFNRSNLDKYFTYIFKKADSTSTHTAKEVKVKETELVEGTLETPEENIKSTVEIAPDGKVEETIDGGDGQSITIVH